MYREEVRREELRREQERREVASRAVVRVLRAVVHRRRFLQLRSTTTTLEAAWRGRQGRRELQNRWTQTQARYSYLLYWLPVLFDLLNLLTSSRYRQLMEVKAGPPDGSYRDCQT